MLSSKTRRFPDQVDQREVREVREVRPAPGQDQLRCPGFSSRQNISSRFSAVLEQPGLAQTASEKMRTPR